MTNPRYVWILNLCLSLVLLLLLIGFGMDDFTTNISIAILAIYFLILFMNFAFSIIKFISRNTILVLTPFLLFLPFAQYAFDVSHLDTDLIFMLIYAVIFMIPFSVLMLFFPHFTFPKFFERINDLFKTKTRETHTKLFGSSASKDPGYDENVGKSQSSIGWYGFLFTTSAVMLFYFYNKSQQCNTEFSKVMRYLEQNAAGICTASEPLLYISLFFAIMFAILLIRSFIEYKKEL